MKAILWLTAITCIQLAVVAQTFPVDDRVPTDNCDGCIGVPSSSPIITAVRDIMIHGEDSSILHNGGLFEGASLFMDRLGWLAVNVPTELEGADYIELAQDLADYARINGFYPGVPIHIEVDVVQGAVLYLFVDTVQQYNNGGQLPFPWMANVSEWGGLTWEDTGCAGIDGYLPYYIYRVGPLEAGTYHFREQDVDSAMYSIAALRVPPPELAITHESDGSVHLTWENPSGLPACILQQCPDLSVGNWESVSVSTPAQHEIAEPTGTMFYRLMEP